MSTILVTGSAGFIGANLVMRLLRTPDQVVGDVKGVGGDDGLTIVGLDNMIFAGGIGRNLTSRKWTKGALVA